MSTIYTDLLPSQHRNQPRFVAALEVLTQALAGITAAVQALPQSYSIDTAVGAQLDVVGQWVGVSRRLLSPIPNVYFTFDEAGKGWDEGYWKPAFAPVDGIEYLDDTSYRAVLRLAVAAHHWDGTNRSYAALPVQLEGSAGNIVSVYDRQDMTLDVRVLGVQPSLFLRQVIAQQNLIPRPMGVGVHSYTYTNVPVFGVDRQDGLVAGLDVGYFPA